MQRQTCSFLYTVLVLQTTLTLSENKHEDIRRLRCLHKQMIVDEKTIYLNGTLVTPDGAAYSRGEWERFGDRFRVCTRDERPIFPMCCKEGEAIISFDNFSCAAVPEEQQYLLERRPVLYREAGLVPLILSNETSMFDDFFDIKYGYPCFENTFLPESFETDQFYLLEDGMLAAWGGAEMYNASTYCYLMILESEELLPLVCRKETSSEHTPLKFILYSVGLLMSVPFLVATYIVYACLSSLHSTHGQCVMSHVLVLTMGYICLPITAFQTEIGDENCMALAFIIYFSFLASFFWLNVMCLDIWWTFSGYRPMRGSVKEREHKKFIIYSLYCWGSPLIMLIICMVMDLHPDIPNSYHKPGFGETKCWFKSNTSNLIYFSGPIAILIVCNIVLFILTAIKIRQVKRGTKILTKQDSRRHNEEEENNAQRFNLYFKLFLVMGVNWIMEIISFAAGGPDEWWYITDIANTLQGVLIFIIFVWKDRIRRLLIERFCPNRAANNNSVDQTSSTRTTTIRNNIGSKSRVSFKNKEAHAMNKLTSSPSVISDDSDVP